MIQRVVLIKLKPSYADRASVQSIIEKTREILPRAHGVLRLEIATPIDDRTRRAWDLCLFVRFATAEDVEAYRTDSIHRCYADTFLKPLREKIYVYHFELADP